MQVVGWRAGLLLFCMLHVVHAQPGTNLSSTPVPSTNRSETPTPSTNATQTPGQSTIQSETPAPTTITEQTPSPAEPASQASSSTTPKLTKTTAVQVNLLSPSTTTPVGTENSLDQYVIWIAVVLASLGILILGAWIVQKYHRHRRFNDKPMCAYMQMQPCVPKPCPIC